MSESAPAIEIKASPAKLLFVTGLGVLMTGLGVLLVWRPFECDRCSFISDAIGVVAAVFFGACTLGWLWRLLTTTGATVVTISPDGIRDTRIAAEFVPWRDIEDISTWDYRGQKTMVLKIPDAVWDRLPLTLIARWSRDMNRAFGADGLAVSAQGLKIEHDRLIALCTQHRDAARASASPSDGGAGP